MQKPVGDTPGAFVSDFHFGPQLLKHDLICMTFLVFDQAAISNTQGTGVAFHTTDTCRNGPQYLRKFHLHVSKHMEEADHCIPQPTVSQALLVPDARALWRAGHP